MTNLENIEVALKASLNDALVENKDLMRRKNLLQFLGILAILSYISTIGFAIYGFVTGIWIGLIASVLAAVALNLIAKPIHEHQKREVLIADAQNLKSLGVFEDEEIEAMISRVEEKVR